MIRLGDITYSNCFPVHARFIDRGPPDWVTLVRGTPGELNAELAAGRVDVAPCSSIEYARHAAEYVLLPDLSIASDGDVGSIVLESRVPVAALDGALVAIPTASATSVVLLRALLEERYGVGPEYQWFDQSATDPFRTGAAAALWIGDVALRRSAPAGHRRIDLGGEWTQWTGLPFVYALWQARHAGTSAQELRRLHGELIESRAWFERNAEALAGRHAERFGMAQDRLLRYWRTIRYDMDERLEQGLHRFWAYAVRLGEAPSVPALEWLAPLPHARRGRDAGG
ncbi:MAG: menaquinone biosynthesis protein [Gemmatimonadetes bacterium]|nr:menaquinone biosynthesis protein [Gemmatimonadota bacterium]